jgi:hypothetical protein
LVLFFVIFSFYHQDIFSLSSGDRYFRRLNRWYELVKIGQWDKASKLEKKFENDDIRYYKEKYLPSAIEKRLKEKYLIKQKTIDDWLEITQMETLLNHPKEAYQAIKEAYKIDPIRSDVEKIYFTFPDP